MAEILSDMIGRNEQLRSIKLTSPSRFPLSKRMFFLQFSEMQNQESGITEESNIFENAVKEDSLSFRNEKEHKGSAFPL